MTFLNGLRLQAANVCPTDASLYAADIASSPDGDHRQQSLEGLVRFTDWHGRLVVHSRPAVFAEERIRRHSIEIIDASRDDFVGPIPPSNREELVNHCVWESPPHLAGWIANYHSIWSNVSGHHRASSYDRAVAHSDT